MKFTLALAQVDSVVGDIRKNVLHHVEFARRAHEGGADLVVFPELSLSGYSVKDLNWDLALHGGNDAVLDPLKDASRKIAIIAGGVEESQEFGIFNSAFYFSEGNVETVHRKMYPPTYGMFEEMRYFNQGTGVRAFETPLGKLGVLICEDLWHLPLPYLLAQQGTPVIIAIAASPTRLSATENALEIGAVNTEHHKTYARLLSSYVVFCNRVGFEDGVNFWGGSEVIGPGGETLVHAKYFDEDLVFAEIEENAVRRARRFSRHFLDENIHLTARELRHIIKERDRS